METLVRNSESDIRGLEKYKNDTLIENNTWIRKEAQQRGVAKSLSEQSREAAR
jgi:hypothetical protein